jgi:hypothetical protein
LEVQNRALIKTARERAERIDELERELQSAASQIGQLQRELQTVQARTGKFERDLQAVQDRTGKLERDFQAAQGRTDIERDLQQARNEVERLTLERDFYSKKASTLEEENRQLTECVIKYSEHARKPERERRRSLPSTLYGLKSWNANSIGLIPMVRLDGGSMQKKRRKQSVSFTRHPLWARSQSLLRVVAESGYKTQVPSVSSPLVMAAILGRSCICKGPTTLMLSSGVESMPVLAQSITASA